MRLAQLIRIAWPHVPVRHDHPGAGKAGRRKSRTAVLSGGVAVLLALACLAVAVETVRPEWRDPEYGYRLKQFRLPTGATRLRQIVAVVGSSRVVGGFSPGHLGFVFTPSSPFVYNFAHTTYGPAGEFLATRRLLDSGVVPDHLLVEVMPPFLSEAIIPDTMIRPEHTGYADLGRLAPYRPDQGSARWAWAAARFNSWHSLRFALLSHLGAEDWLPAYHPADVRKGMRVGGWTPPAMSATSAERTAALERTRCGYAHFFANYRVHPLQDRIYRDLLGLCREHGIRVAFFLMPESPTFRGWYPPGGRELVRSYLAALSREYGPPVFDASEWMSDESMFGDGHHLLYPGAEAFSERFGKECLGPWLAGGR